MRILLDENVPAPLTLVLRSFVLPHQIAHVSDMKWSGAKDRDLYRMAADERFEVVVTNDEKQLQRRAEVEAIAASGVHRVQYPHRHTGLTGLGAAIGTVCAGLPLALDVLEHTNVQLLIRLVSVDPTPGARLKITNPADSPPKFWPTDGGALVPRQATGSDHPVRRS